MATTLVGNRLLGLGLPGALRADYLPLDLTRKRAAFQVQIQRNDQSARTQTSLAMQSTMNPPAPLMAKAVSEGNVAVPANKVPNKDTVSVAKENVFATPSLSGKAVSKFPIGSITKMKKVKPYACHACRAPFATHQIRIAPLVTCVVMTSIQMT